MADDGWVSCRIEGRADAMSSPGLLIFRMGPKWTDIVTRGVDRPAIMLDKSVAELFEEGSRTLGMTRIAPNDRRLTNIDAAAFGEPLGYPAPREAPARSRLKRLFGAVGCLVAAYILMHERAFGLAPFVVLLGWLWVKGSVECAQARGSGLDW